MMGAGAGGGSSFGSWPRRANRRGMSEINITAFVDVLLVLLIIFMMTSQYMQQGIEINVPDAQAPGLESSSDPLIVSLSVDQKLAVGDITLADIEELRPMLEAEIAASGGRPVYLKADTQVPYGVIVGIMARIRQAGIHDIGLMTESGPEEWFDQ
jgi:biopolymer transport protein TolR